MELKNDHKEQQPSSVFQGDEIWVSRILAREVSKGQSSSSFYRAAEGVPFKWETNPGTPKHPQEEDQIFPLCPSPLMQSLGLPLPNLEGHDHEAKGSALKPLIISSLRKLVKNSVICDISKKVEKLGSWRSKQQGSSVKGSSFSSNSSLSTFSSSSRVLDTPSVDDPLCCDPSDIHAIPDEGNTRIYFCSHHKTAFAVEEDNSSPSRIKSRISASDQFSITPLEDELKDKSTCQGVRYWRREKKESVDAKNGTSLITRYDHQNMEISGFGEEFESVSMAGSKKSRESGSVVKMNYLSCSSPWIGTRFAVLAKKKFKSYIS